MPVISVLLARVNRIGLRSKTSQSRRRSFALTASTNISITALNAIGGIAAARLLGPEGRGQLAAAVVWAAMIGVLVTLGVPQALTFYCARDRSSVGTIFQSALILWLVQSVVGVALGWQAAGWALSGGEPETVRAVHAYLLSVPPALLTTYLSTIAQGLGRFRLFNAIRAIAGLTYVLGIGIAIVFNMRQAHGVVVLLLAGQVAAGVCATVLFRVQVRPYGSGDWKSIARLLNYGLRSYSGSISWAANARLDQFVMSAVVSPGSLGQYAVAVSYASVLFPLSGAVAMVLFPRVAALKPQEAQPAIRRALVGNAAMAAIGAVVLGIAAPMLLPSLFGNAYQPAIGPALVLLAASVFLGSNYVLSDALRGLGKPGLPSVAELGALCVTLLGLYIFLRPYGILAAAVVSLSSYAVATTILTLGLKKTGLHALVTESRRDVEV